MALIHIFLAAVCAAHNEQVILSGNMHGELERMGEEAGTSRYYSYTSISLEGHRKTTKLFSKDGTCLS